MTFFNDQIKRSTTRELSGTTLSTRVLERMKNGEDRLNDHQSNELRALLQEYAKTESRSGKNWQGMTTVKIREVITQLNAGHNFTQIQLQNIQRYLSETL